MLGGHIDSVPQGGWLDGALNTVAALEVMRRPRPRQRPVTLRLVDWATRRGPASDAASSARAPQRVL
jgi:N-carbamoyl-L-amino-acid hydrolase